VTVLDYYRQRAATYDRIYDRPERQADLQALQATLPGFFAGRSVLEVACGTGWWTPHGARAARRWLATDLAPETLALARARQLPPCVTFRQADALDLAAADLGDERFDAAFAGFWCSHLPRAALAPWLQTLHARLDPGACVMLLDNRYVAGSSTPIARTDAAGDSWQRRTLDDGSTHELRKNFLTRDATVAALGPRAHAVCWTDHTHYWVLTYRLA
jgi:demethylmenaquinone methyltransferase/2-methoxy-6-polyprenyl-1,4-benzoquinol methylase